MRLGEEVVVVGDDVVAWAKLRPEDFEALKKRPDRLSALMRVAASRKISPALVRRCDKWLKRHNYAPLEPLSPEDCQRIAAGERPAEGVLIATRDQMAPAVLTA